MLKLVQLYVVYHRSIYQVNIAMQTYIEVLTTTPLHFPTAADGAANKNPRMSFSNSFVTAMTKFETNYEIAD